MIFSSFALALADLANPHLQKVFWKTLALAILLLAVFFGGMWFVLSHVPMPDWGWLDRYELLNDAGALALFVVIPVSLFIACWVLFTPVMTAVMGFYVDGVMDEVNALHYPDVPPIRTMDASAALIGGIRFLVLAGVINLLMIPVYAGMAVSIILLPAILPLAFCLNAYLMGRELFFQAAWRQNTASDIRRFMKRKRLSIFMASLLCGVCFTIPVVNLFAPLISAATMVHLFHGLRGDRRVA